MTRFFLTNDAKYRQTFERTFDFVRQHQICKQGGWWATVAEDPVEHPSRASMWQGAYLNGRALLLCERLLQQQ